MLPSIAALMGEFMIDVKFFSDDVSYHRYSRKVLWLSSAKSNNNPNTIAYYYLECIKDRKGMHTIWM